MALVQPRPAGSFAGAALVLFKASCTPLSPRDWPVARIATPQEQEPGSAKQYVTALAILKSKNTKHLGLSLHYCIASGPALVSFISRLCRYDLSDVCPLPACLPTYLHR